MGVPLFSETSIWLDGGIFMNLREPQHTPWSLPRTSPEIPNDSGIPKHKLLGQGGVWGMFQRYVGTFFEWSFNHTCWQRQGIFFCSVWLCGNYCTFTNQSLSNDFAFIFWGVYQNHNLISYLLMPVPMSQFVDSQPLNKNSFNQGTTFWRGVWNPKQPVSNFCLCKVFFFDFLPW